MLKFIQGVDNGFAGASRFDDGSDPFYAYFESGNIVIVDSTGISIDATDWSTEGSGEFGGDWYLSNKSISSVEEAREIIAWLEENPEEELLSLAKFIFIFQPE